MARRASVSTRVIDHGFDAALAHARRLDGRGVKVGVQAGEGSEDGTDLLDILIYNEFGTRHIPARPVMRSYFDGAQQEIGREADNAGTFAMRTGQIDLAMGRLGAYMQKGLQAHWRGSKGWAVPNSPTTIAIKGSDVPLIDNGTLINAVRWQVV